MIKGIKKYLYQSYLSYKALYMWLSFDSYIFLKVINPVLQMIFYCLIALYLNGTKNISYYIVGNSFISCSVNIFFGISYIMQEERNFGTLKSIFVSSENKFLILTEKIFLNLIDGFICVIAILFFGCIVFDTNIFQGNLGYLFLAIFLGIFSSAGLGLLLSGFGFVCRDLNMIVNTFNMLFIILTGANCPIEILPVFLQKISFFIPLGRSIKVGRLVNSSLEYTVANKLLLQEFILGIFYFVLSYILISYLQKLAQKNATVDSI